MGAQGGVKTCSRCNVQKSADGFYTDKTSKDGLKASCKQCVSERGKAYREANKEQKRAASRRYYLANKDACKARAKKWAENNRERQQENHARWMAQNQERYLLTRRRRYLRTRNDPDLRRRRAEYKKANADKFREYFERGRAKYLARVKAAPGTCSLDAWEARLDAIGRRCFYCSGPYQAIDHTIPVSRGGSNWPANLRPICKRCNSSKGNKTPREWEAFKRLADDLTTAS